MKVFWQRKILIALAVSFVVSILSIDAGASSLRTDEIPFESYTYWEDYSGGTKKAVYSRPMFEASYLIDSTMLGTQPFVKLTDICTDLKGNTYILDGGASRVVVLDSSYKITDDIRSISNDGENYDFSQARGIYVDRNDKMYICDTENSRVLVSDTKGNLIRKYLVPESSLIPDKFQFRPIKVAADSQGYVYILSDGSFYGSMLYAPDDEFIGFFGANTVTGSAIETLEIIWNKLFLNNIKRSAIESQLPYQFTDLYIDSSNFIYTTTGRTSRYTGDTGQIRCFSPGGLCADNTSSRNFADVSVSKINNIKISQDLLGIALDKDGFIYALDSSFGRIFVYDSDYNLLSAFGGGMGYGSQLGTFALPCAIETVRDDILVCDTTKNNVTVFNATDYGLLVKKAQLFTISGDYESAGDILETILAADRNSQLAYRGLAAVKYHTGAYSEALDYSKLGLDRHTYALAFSQVRREFMSRNFTAVFISVILLLAVAIASAIILKRRNIVLIKNNEARLMFASIPHPFLSFARIKENAMGSLRLGSALVVLFYLLSALEYTAGGFMYVNFNSAEVNSVFLLIRTFGLVALWVTVNWAVCTLLGGSGKFKEIFLVASYSLLPLIIGKIVFIVFSNLLIPTEAGFLSVFTNICIGYALVMLAIGSIKIHDYSLTKFLGTGLMTLVGMGIVLFLIAVIMILIQQLGGFIMTLFNEVIYR